MFLPLLAKWGFDTLVRRADYPGTKMIPADAALLSLLALLVPALTLADV